MFILFEQNAACELRISDWSSDVCSSDLEHFRLLLVHMPGEDHLQLDQLELLAVECGDRLGPPMLTEQREFFRNVDLRDVRIHVVVPGGKEERAMLSLAKGNEALMKFLPKAGSPRARIVNRGATITRLEDLLLTPIPASGWRGQAPTGRLSRVPSTQDRKSTRLNSSH